MNIKRIIIIVLLGFLLGLVIWYLLKPLTNENTISDESKAKIEKLLQGFVRVEGGTFLMGAPDSIGEDDETQHSVYVSTYSIQSTEVTQELYELVMGNNPSENKSWKDMPVTNVSYDDCQVFIKKLNDITNKEYRLPTEAEWEYAAKGGLKSQGYLYSGGNNLEEVGWVQSNSGNSIHVVAEKKANELGLYDMTGNVWEWCSDWYGPYRKDSKGSENPIGPDNGINRVLRGGCFYYGEDKCRNSLRSWYYPRTWYDINGFRLVLTDTR